MVTFFVYTDHWLEECHHLGGIRWRLRDVFFLAQLSRLGAAGIWKEDAPGEYSILEPYMRNV
jgi:hypothetical protein